MPAGYLWRAQLRNGSSLWLLEWALRRRLRRRVLVAADTSDSCAGESESRRLFFATLMDVLDPGDSCVVWILGGHEPAHEVLLTRPQDRRQLAQELSAALTDVRCGTWIADTARAMLARAQQTSPGEYSRLLLVSDGEVFDVEALPNVVATQVGFVRLGNLPSSQLEVLKKRTTEVASTPQALRDFLGVSWADATLDPGWTGERAIPFTADGALTAGEPFVAAPDLDVLRVAFVGGAAPQPALVYRAGGSSWSDTTFAEGPLADDAPPHLRAVLRNLNGGTIDWDWERLCTLTRGAPQNPLFNCPRPKCHAPASPVRRRLFCGVCEALVVSRDGVRRSELPCDIVRFQILTDGSLGPQQSCDCDTGDDAFAVIEQEGHRWLVLDLIRN